VLLFSYFYYKGGCQVLLGIRLYDAGDEGH